MRISHWSSDVCSSDVLYLPIGAESSLKGVVDLVNNRGIVWQDESLGAKFDYVEIPADMADKAAEYREQMIETVVEQDDAGMEEIGRASCRERVCRYV